MPERKGDINSKICYNDRPDHMNRWKLAIIYYHKIMVIYPYPFWVLITQFSPGKYLLMILYVF